MLGSSARAGTKPSCGTPRPSSNLKKLPITDRRSWRYLAAMHQFDRDLWIDLGIITATTRRCHPDEDTGIAWTSMPALVVYFLPGIAVISRASNRSSRDDRLDQGKPGWKLPYWNYLDAATPMRAKFRGLHWRNFCLPGRSCQESAAGRAALWPKGARPRARLHIDDIDLAAMDETDFTGSVSFGGSQTLFRIRNWACAASSRTFRTARSTSSSAGARPAIRATDICPPSTTAGLDPLFWLHHCNIDRLWEAWMTKVGSNMESGKQWLDGPSGRAFAVPKLDGTDLENFTARDTLSGGKFHVGYDDLHAGTGVPVPPVGAWSSQPNKDRHAWQNRSYRSERRKGRAR